MMQLSWCRDRGIGARDASDLQRQVEVWQDLRECDPSGFATGVCSGITIKVRNFHSVSDASPESRCTVSIVQWLFRPLTGVLLHCLQNL